MTRGAKLFGTVFAASLFFLGCVSSAKADTVVTFSGGTSVIGSGSPFVVAYTEQGFSFSSGLIVDIQTDQLVVRDGNDRFPISVTHEGGAFSFLSFDYVFAGGGSFTTFTASNGATFTATFPGTTYVLGPEFQNITSLLITHFRTAPEGATFNVYDNFRFQTSNTSAVPEPATMLLLVTGLAGVCAAARKGRKAGGVL